MHFRDFLVIEQFITMDYLILSLCHLDTQAFKYVLSRTLVTIQYFDGQ